MALKDDFLFQSLLWTLKSLIASQNVSIKHNFWNYLHWIKSKDLETLHASIYFEWLLAETMTKYCCNNTFTDYVVN